MVKEFTGHRSDALDAYQITSDDQRESLSKILACPSAPNIGENKPEVSKATAENTTPQPSSDLCTCKCNIHNVTPASQIAQIVNEVVSRNIKDNITNVKVEIEFTSK